MSRHHVTNSDHTCSNPENVCVRVVYRSMGKQAWLELRRVFKRDAVILWRSDMNPNRLLSCQSNKICSLDKKNALCCIQTNCAAVINIFSLTMNQTSKVWKCLFTLKPLSLFFCATFIVSIYGGTSKGHYLVSTAHKWPQKYTNAVLKHENIVAMCSMKVVLNGGLWWTLFCFHTQTLTSNFQLKSGGRALKEHEPVSHDGRKRWDRHAGKLSASISTLVFDQLRTDSLNKTCDRSDTDSPVIDYQITYFCLWRASLFGLPVSEAKKWISQADRLILVHFGRRAQSTPESQPLTRGLRFNVNTL